MHEQDNRFPAEPFPASIDWKNPDVASVSWIRHVQSHVSRAYFDVFQEYELGERPPWFSSFWSRGTLPFRMLEGVNGRPEEGWLYRYFGDKLVKWHNTLPNTDWVYFISYDAASPSSNAVIGAGQMHFSEVNREYASGFRIELDTDTERTRFFDLLESKDPRKVLELYLVSLLGRDKFPANEEAHQTYEREIFYPFASSHGSLTVHLNRSIT